MEFPQDFELSGNVLIQSKQEVPVPALVYLFNVCHDACDDTCHGVGHQRRAQ